MLNLSSRPPPVAVLTVELPASLHPASSPTVQTAARQKVRLEPTGCYVLLEDGGRKGGGYLHAVLWVRELSKVL